MSGDDAPPPLRRGLASIREPLPAITSIDSKPKDKIHPNARSQQNIDKMPFYIRYVKPDLYSIKKRENKLLARSQLDHQILRHLTQNRRDTVVNFQKVIQRQGPPPDILSQEYEQKSHIVKTGSKFILPLPSKLVNEDPFDAFDPSKERTSDAQVQLQHTLPPLPLYHPSLRTSFSKRPEIPNQETEKMLIQKPVVIYWKRIKTFNI